MRASILYLSPGVFDKGGISRYCRYQVRALRELLGEDAVEVLSLAPPHKNDFEDPFEVSFASFGGNTRGRVVFSGAAAVAALTSRPRVVWSAHAYLGPLALALAKGIGARFVLNVYGAEVWTAVTPARRFALQRADALLSDCHATLRHVVSAGLHRELGTSVHWDCVDASRFRPGPKTNVLEKYGVPPEGPQKTLLTLARLSEDERHKGVDRLIEVMGRLRDVPVRLVVAGGGSWLEKLRKMASDADLAGRVFFTGRVAEADLADVYRACDVFSLVTTKGPGTGEGLPLTPIEASACGRPILVGTEDGSIEAVVDGVTGYAVDPRDLEATARHVRELVADDALRARLGAAGAERTLRDMGYDVFAKRLEPVAASLGLLPAR